MARTFCCLTKMAMINETTWHQAKELDQIHEEVSIMNLSLHQKFYIKTNLL